MPVPEELVVFARELRKNQTDAEALLWNLLRSRRFCGFKFRRQYPLEGYVLDFYCHETKLAIELDGGGHNFAEQRLYDKERTNIIEASGVRVIRFWNNEVLSQLDVALEQIYVHLMKGKSNG